MPVRLHAQIRRSMLVLFDNILIHSVCFDHSALLSILKHGFVTDQTFPKGLVGLVICGAQIIRLNLMSRNTGDITNDAEHLHIQNEDGGVQLVLQVHIHRFGDFPVLRNTTSE